jgi:hypothetical protein
MSGVLKVKGVNIDWKKQYLKTKKKASLNEQ